VPVPVTTTASLSPVRVVLAVCVVVGDGVCVLFFVFVFATPQICSVLLLALTFFPFFLPSFLPCFLPSFACALLFVLLFLSHLDGMARRRGSVLLGLRPAGSVGDREHSRLQRSHKSHCAGGLQCHRRGSMGVCVLLRGMCVWLLGGAVSVCPLMLACHTPNHDRLRRRSPRSRIVCFLALLCCDGRFVRGESMPLGRFR